MRRKKSNFSNKYFEKETYRRKRLNIQKEERVYYSTEIVVKDDENLEFIPEIKIYIVSIDDTNVQKELDDYSYQKYLRDNYYSKKGGDCNE